MQHSDSLRIRTPIAEIQTRDYDKISEDSNQNKSLHRIPTYILIISMTNFTIFIYNGDLTHLYFSIITTILWVLSLLDAIYDTKTMTYPREAATHLESEV
jgi:hypothetical protein